MTEPAPEREQADTIAFLADPATYGNAGPVERIDTHISRLFLAGPRVFKLKRAVRFPYLDFTTRERRRAACAAEVAVNRRTAPDLYLGIAPVLRGPSGRLRLGEIGEAGGGGETACDWVVVMRRFDQATLFDALAAHGALTAEMVTNLAETVAAFHERAAPAPGFGGMAGMRLALDGILAEIARFTPSVFGSDDARRCDTQLRTALAELTPLLDARAAAGKVRRGHGDLHLRNICLIEGRPTPFDAIEFNDALANIDVLYDLAFLLMDLEHRGLRPFANLALNGYLGRAPDHAGLAALPFFLACRAAVRAHVAATQAVEAEPASRTTLATDAAGYLSLALAFLKPAPVRLVAVGGLSGTGKTALARALAPLFGRAPGAVHLRSDVIRKRLCGVSPLTRLGPEGYTEEVTARVYRAIAAEAATALQAGHAVVADAVFARAEERAAIAAAAERAGVAFDGLWLDADEPTRLARVRRRTGDASDADARVVRMQAAFAPDTTGWCRIDAGGDMDATWELSRRALILNEKSPTL